MIEGDFPDALPTGAKLHWYVIERVLGQGGFGITYLAHDSNLDRRVAIKEYLPSEIARRRGDASAKPHTESQAERFAWGLDRFLAEARTLARFDHPNIVRVLSVFEANNTAYMVMRFEEGEDLASLLERRGTLPERQLTDCLLPVLDGLALVHASGFIHRDIKPENIYVRKDGSPVLLDFGSARQSFGSAKTMTILVAPGYAPLEQYYGDAATQGPWTDIYGLGATCYRAIAGHTPLDAVARAKGVLGSAREVLQPALEAGRGRYREAFLAAVDHSLQLSEKDRPQTIGEWRRELVADAAAAPLAEAASAAGAVASKTDRHGQPASEPVATAPGPAVPAASAPERPATTRPGEPLLGVPAAGASVVEGSAGVASFHSAAELRSGPAVAAATAAAPPVARRPPPWLLPGLGVAALAVFAVVWLGQRREPDRLSTPVEPAHAIEATRASPASLPGAASAAPITAAASMPGPGSAGVAQANPAPPEPASVGREKSASIAAVPVRPAPTVRETTAAAREPARPAPERPVLAARRPDPLAATPALRPSALPVDAGARTTPAGSTPASLATATPAPNSNAAAPATAPLSSAREGATPRSARDEQLEAAEAALRRGDAATAARLLQPLAAAGVGRAQALLGRAQEARPSGQQSDFEAFIWYGIAARNGQAGAQAQRDRVAGKLQPAEIHQAEQIIERWKPHPEATPAERARSEEPPR